MMVRKAEMLHQPVGALHLTFEGTIFRNSAQQHGLLRIDIAMLPVREDRHGGKVADMAEKQRQLAPVRGTGSAAGRVIVSKLKL